MAYTTPRTYVAGEIHTAAHHNTYERDNIAWLATDSPACRAYHNTSQSITTSGTEQAVVLNSERFDNASVHSTSSNTDRMTVPTGGGGKYLFVASWSWTSSAAGNYRQARAKLNGTTVLARMSLQPSGTHGSEGVITTSYALSAADYVSLYVVQDSGGALNLLSDPNFSPEVQLYWFRT